MLLQKLRQPERCSWERPNNRNETKKPGRDGQEKTDQHCDMKHSIWGGSYLQCIFDLGLSFSQHIGNSFFFMKMVVLLCLPTRCRIWMTIICWGIFTRQSNTEMKKRCMHEQRNDVVTSGWSKPTGSICTSTFKPPPPEKTGVNVMQW